MFDVRQLFLSLLSCVLLPYGDFSVPRQQVTQVNKSVVVVGAGSAGLAMLRALVDLQDELDSNLDIVLYEQCRDVGGIWCVPCLLTGNHYLSMSVTQAPRPTTRPPAGPARNTAVPPSPHQHARTHDDLSWLSVSA